MASDLSSECTEAIGVLDEKEEGEISLEDVSSSEEGHVNYGYGSKTSQCSNCLSTQHNATWCSVPAKFYPPKGTNRRDAVQGKENRHQIKESGCIGTKHTTSTLQEKNDDLVPISSDSDMEIVGLADNSKQITIHSSAKSRMKKKRKKKRNHVSSTSLDDLVSSSTVDISMKECINTIKHDVTKNSSRSHHREVSPIHRSNRSKVIPRSPPKRHRSLIKPRSPFRRSKSPIIRTRSPTIRRSPRRLKSPKRSPYKSSTKTMPRKTSHIELMSSRNYVDTHKLLKKVRQLGSIGTHSLEETLNKNKEHASSLKEKLTNMMKGVSDNNIDLTNSSKEKTIINVNKKESNDIDDEEDLALLRQKALETKQNKSNKQNDVSKTETSKQVSANINDDQDEEDLELRMIALRSAVLKKHQNRIQKGIKSGKYKKSDTFRSESPFTQSFLDSIPIPGEELLNFASPPHSPLPINENNHTEDMELDTDVEREKEKLPYSPTDKITANIPMDTELLGIQPSDVSFITVNEANNSPNFNTSVTSSQDDQKSYQGKIIENQSYLPNIVYYTPSQNSLCVTNTNVQYLPTDLSETSKSNFMKIHNSHLNIPPYENICIAKNNNNTSEALDINSSQEMPYSPTDTPIYDPDLSHALPQTLGALTISNSSLVSLESYISNTHGSNEQHNHISTDQHIQSTKDISNENEHLNKAEVLSLEPVTNFTTTSLMETLSPSSSMITIDDLPEIEADVHLTDTVRNLKTEYIPNDLSNNINEKIVEPLYMKGLPDVTKDTNKIPTLINRTLVPAPILKTNKQLQLPLPTKKNITQQEPTFKSAEMQPVVLHEETSIKTNASFKPIKLTSFLQKSHSVLAIPTAFHDSLHEDLINETSTDKSSHTSLIESNPNVTLVQNNTTNITNSEKTSDIKSPTPKKKKLSKKGLKKRSIGPVLIAKNHNTTCIKSDNVNTVDKHESQQVLYTDDNQDQKGIQIEMDQIDNIDVSMSETSKNIITEKNNISSENNEKEIQNNDNSMNDISEQIKNTEDRRQSLDEDEEALRAILLASLPKRTKITNNCSNSDTISTASTTLNQVLVNETVSNIVLPTSNLSIPHVNGSENDKNQSNSGEKVNNITQKDLSVDNNKTLNITTLGRKRSINMTKGPQRKLIKRISIPASTKVVNNAKKYQNTMIQKRLNLQKSTLYNKQKVTENKILPKVQSNDSKWSANSKALSDTQRIVINLESDTESDSESERQKNITVSSVHSVITEKHQPTINSTTEFEKNLDQFLRAVRRKQESMAAARPTSISQTPKKDTVLTTKSEKLNSSNNLHTPLAVRHLPVSQQEEYRRLKQQILEREKLKLHRTMENNSLIKNKNMEIFSKSTLSNSQNKELCIKINQISTKSQNINTQQLNKENCSKNLIDSIKNTAISTNNNIQTCNKTCNVVDKRENTNPNQTKLLSRSTTNSDVCVSIENNPNNIRNKIVENSVQPTSTSRKIFEMPTQKIEMKTRISPGLKILSIDEVNQKYVQIQVKNDTNERVVTINDKVSLNNKAVINRNENISGYKDNNNKNTCDYDINNMLSTNNIISNDNNAVDSDASTVILSERHEDRKENLDTSESTISLSQHQEDLSSISNAENNHFLFIQNNISSKDTKSIEENWDEIKKDVKTELNTLINLSRVEQEQRLIDTEEKLVMKRYTILDDLAEMSSNLRQWHMERDLQTNLVAEVKKLREQLKVAEERLQIQRNRINNIGPRVVAAHEKVNAGRQECFKLATICSTLGNRIMGKEYKVPEAGAQLLDNRLKEVANHTRQLSRKKVPSIDISDMYELSRLEEETVSTTCTEISQNKSQLLEECNIDTSILNEDQSRIKSSDIEKNIQIEDITINKNKTDKETDIILNISTLSFDERCISKQNDIEQKIFEETNLSNSNTTTTNILKPEDIQKLDSNMSENNIIRPIILKPGTKKRNSTKFEGELQRKKTLLSYESILTHFKIPRNTNPNGVLCPYELMGTCSDGDCQFIHQTESQTK